MNTLEMLADERIFSIELSDSKETVTIQEECDYYFSVEMKKDELFQLISELQDIANQMK